MNAISVYHFEWNKMYECYDKHIETRIFFPSKYNLFYPIYSTRIWCVTQKNLQFNRMK